MKIRKVSAIVFYRDDGKILIQDRRNIEKDDIEWGFFGGGWEEWETIAEEVAIREIQEELNVSLQNKDLQKIGTTHTEYEDIGLEVHLFVTPWKDSFDTIFEVREWAGSLWVSPHEMRKLHLYPTEYPNIDIIERFLSSKYA